MINGEWYGNDSPFTIYDSPFTIKAHSASNFAKPMISVSEAIRLVLAKSGPLPPIQVPFYEARGCVLAQDIIADSDLPPFDRSQMDGYAVRAQDTFRAPAVLRIVGESAAGRGWHKIMNAGEAVRIMTGAPVPSGADSVQQVELTRERDGLVEIMEPVTVGKSITRHATEIKSGQVVLRAGERISPAMMAVFASFGYTQVKVAPRPRVAVLATGSELVQVNQQPAQDQIRDANSYSISAYAEAAGATVERLPLADDNIESLTVQIKEASERSDVLISSGGVSMGLYDFTKTALRELQAEIFFERVSLKPGKPTVFARFGNGTLVFGLPGNPVSVSVTFSLFARTAIYNLQGATQPKLHEEWAVLGRPVKASPDRESYLPARLSTSQEGLLMAIPLKWGGSSDFVAFSQATALIIVPAGVTPAVEGVPVKIVRLDA